MIQNVKKYDYTVQDVYFGLFGYHRSMSSQTLNWVILITHFRVWKALRNYLLEQPHVTPDELFPVNKHSAKFLLRH